MESKLTAEELRIGNYVLKSLKSGQGRKIIDKIGVQDLIRIREDIGCFNYECIPLTEEILLKCGFDFGIKLQDFVKGKYQFVEIINTIDGYFSEEGILYYGLITKIKHLHQLQNLYFALTNQELKIEL